MFYKTMNYSVISYTVIVGDFICSDIDWTHQSATTSKPLLDTINDCFMNQHIDFSTRPSSNTQPDLVLSTDENTVRRVTDLGKLGKGDHCMIQIDIAGQVLQPKTVEYVPDWRKADLAGLSAEVVKVVWQAEFTNRDVDNSWNRFKTVLHDLQDKFIPKRIRRSQTKPIWMSPNTLRIVRKKRRLWKVYTQSKDYAEYLAYKEIEKTAQKAIRKAKRKFEKNLAKQARKKPKDFYRYLKSKSSNRSTVGPLDNGDSVTSDDEEMANLLNDFFGSVFTREDTSSIPSPPITFNSKILSEFSITPEQVAKKLEALKEGSAPGPDNLSAKLLKVLSDALSVPVSMIFNKSISEGKAPSDWKCANITSIFKILVITALSHSHLFYF